MTTVLDLKRAYTELGNHAPGEADYIEQDGLVFGWSESNVRYEYAWFLYVDRAQAAPQLARRIDELLALRPFPREAYHLLPRNGFLPVEVHA